MFDAGALSLPSLHPSSIRNVSRGYLRQVGHQLRPRKTLNLSNREAVLTRAEEDSKADAEVSNVAEDAVEEEEEEEPIWVRREKLKKIQEDEGKDLPYFVYLGGSGVAAIAAVGSVFEFFNKRPVFGLIEPSSLLWLPILALFVFGGLPLSGLLFFRAVEVANKEAEQMDEVDGA